MATKMKNTIFKHQFYMLCFTVFLALHFVACAEDGDEGSVGLECGEHGSEHDGHCHCDTGYLFDGEQCVLPTEITDVCEEHVDEQEEEHLACVCPTTGGCECHGEVVPLEGMDYCQPELHEK